MPSRGTPWRLGKGVPDRIGTKAIKDGSITEADLTQALQDKVNAGGGDDPLTVGFFEDEFIYNPLVVANNITKYEEKYDTEKQGVSALAVSDASTSAIILSGASSTQGITLSSRANFNAFPSGSDINCKQSFHFDLGGGNFGTTFIVWGLMKDSGWNFTNDILNVFRSWNGYWS